MSVLRKLPFINYLVSSLSNEELTTLKEKFNVPSIERKFTFVQDVNGFEFLQTSDAGLICTCTMKLSREKVVSGILVFHSVGLCVLIGYTDGVAGSDILPVYLLNFSNRTYTGFGELLTADELRNVVNDLMYDKPDEVGSIVVANPEGTATATLSKISIQNDGEPVVYDVGGTEVEANPTVPSGVTPTSLSGLKVGSNYYGVSGGSEEIVVYEGTSLLPTGFAMTSWGLHRAIKIGSILWIVVSGDIKNQSGAQSNVTKLYEITLPSDISSKIYRIDGVSCDQATAGGNTRVAYTTVNVDDLVRNLEIRCSAPNVLTLYMTSSVGINDNSSKYFGFRFPLFLNFGE